MLPTSGAGDLPFGWGAQNGYYTDSGTGLVLCGHRYYDPTNGRWLNRDPIGYNGGFNLYRYANDGPTASADSSGYEDWESAGINFITGFGNTASLGLTGWLNGQSGASDLTNTCSPWYAGGGAAAVVVMAIATSGAGAAGGVAGEAAGVEGAAVDGAGVEAGGADGAGADGAGPGPDGGSGGGGSVTQEGIDQIQAHLNSLDPAPYNDAAVQRLQNIADSGENATGYDQNFYQHEVSESESMSQGMDYDAAHAAALDQYGVTEQDLYHPSIVSQYSDMFNASFPRE
jgi:RHS repeat-associated protein